jgi:acyl carrier protein
MWTEAELANDDLLVRWVLERVEHAEDIYVRGGVAPVTAATLLEADLGIDSIGRISLYYEIIDALAAVVDEVEERDVARWRSLADVLGSVRQVVRRT